MSEMNLSGGVKRLFTSSKNLLALLVILAVMVLAYLGRITGEQALDFTKWIVGIALAATALEDGAKKLGIGSK